MRIFLVRHGETEWSLGGRHTGTTDLPLTERGRAVASLQLRPALGAHRFARVLSSPLRRARETCELAGLGHRAEFDDDLTEWDYGEYEGLTSKEIREKVPGWTVFKDGCPGGETARQVGARALRVIEHLRDVDGDVALFAHGHILRVLAASWLGLPAQAGRHFVLDTATIGILGREWDSPAIYLWNAAPVAASGGTDTFR